jgi:hypothetical protein
MTKSILDYQMSTEERLRINLSKLSELHEQGKLKMQHSNVNLGFTKNLETHSTLYMTVGSSYHPVGNAGDKAIIVYVTDCTSGFGLYNEGDPEETCFPIDVHEVVSTWTDEPAHFQKDMLSLLCRHLDDIIERSTT